MKTRYFAQTCLILSLVVLSSVVAAGEERTQGSVKDKFMQMCESWFWNCDCVSRDLFPSAVHALKEEQREFKMAQLRRACEKGSWSSVRGWSRVLTAEELKRLGFEPPADRMENPAASPCDVAERLDAANIDQAIEMPYESLIWLEVAPKIACRNEQGIRKQALTSCSDGEMYNCDCYADRYTKFWMTSERAFGSTHDVHARSEAMSACRRKP
jgi:hypothetical protein